MAKNKCYKVVREGSEGEEFFTSIIASGVSLVLRYYMGCKTTAKIGKLFVFKEKEDAIDFAREEGSLFFRESPTLKILKCDCGELEGGELASLMMSRTMLEEFWGDYPKYVKKIAKGDFITFPYMSVPRGTFFTDYVIPKKKTEYELSIKTI